MPFQVSHVGIGPDNLRYNFNTVRLEKSRKALGSCFAYIYFQASTEITLFGTEVLSKNRISVQPCRKFNRRKDARYI